MVHLTSMTNKKLRYVLYPPLPVYVFCAVFPPLCHIWFCLGFQAKLRIWKVPACKMKPSSTLILECGTPCWACFFIYIPTMTSSQWGLPGRDQKSQPGSEWVSEPNTINTHRQKRLHWRGKKGGDYEKNGKKEITSWDWAVPSLYCFRWKDNSGS